MKKYPFGAILDFWENYKSMIVTEKINLINTKICVISKMESKIKMVCQSFHIIPSMWIQ